MRAWLRRVFGWGVSSTLLLAFIVGVGTWRWFDNVILSDLPPDLSQLRDFRPLTACEITDRDGTVIDNFYLERRYWVELDTLPDHVWQAFVAAEDQHFFEHPGVDLIGITRAFVNNLRGQKLQGGSTLTQQLVKNLLLSPERSYVRKIKELVLAWRLERELTKREILQLYLNFVFLGSGNYGVEAAARDYFDLPASELDPGQAALIAGLVPAPSRYSPRRDPELARWRRSLVLGRMVDEGWIDAVDAIDYDDAAIVPPTRERGEDLGDATAYVTMVRREIRRLLGPDDPFTRGLHVVTPYDPALQRVVIEATTEIREAHLARQGPRVVLGRHGSLPVAGSGGVAGDLPPEPTEDCFVAELPKGSDLGKLRTVESTWNLRREDRWLPVFDERIGQPRALTSQVSAGDRLAVCREKEPGTVRLQNEPWSQSAAVVVENATGRILALTGGSDVKLEGFVRSTQARRQPGSSFKPYVYAAAFAAGHTQLDRILDGPLYLPGGNGTVWSPKNYGGGFAGPTQIRRALAASLNTVSVRLALEVGPTEIARIARSLGVRTPLRTDLTIALGSSEVTPMDQAMGYAALARMGVPVEPVYLDRVEDGDGKVIGHAGGKLRMVDGSEVTLPGGPGRRALDAAVAYETVDALREVVRGGTARRAYVEGKDRAGKTGTTNDNVDAWFVGTTPLYTVAVWIGTDGVGTLGENETGGKGALPAWIKIVDALPDQTGLVFPVPDDAVRVATELGVLGFVRGQVPSNVLPRGRAGDEPLPVLPR